VKRFFVTAFACLIGFSPMAAPRAAPLPAQVQQEIDFLLDDIGTSGCEFYRNGSWHDAKAAQAHVRSKYSFLLARDLIATTEDFIERAASKSSLSGEPYRIRCGASEEIPADRWLRDELARFRSLNRQPGAHLPDPQWPPRQEERGAGRS
jgi:hypothetical protein